jgi:uncharacterized protein (DUF983 family)
MPSVAAGGPGTVWSVHMLWGYSRGGMVSRLVSQPHLKVGESSMAASSTKPVKRPMAVTRGDIIVRGLLHRCPNCGGDGVFRGLFGTNPRCTRCGFLVEREDGFFLGAMALNFGAAAFPLIIVFVLIAMDRISVPLALAITFAWGLIVPVIFYRTSKSLWMMLVYLAVPHQLPANQDPERRLVEHF